MIVKKSTKKLVKVAVDLFEENIHQSADSLMPFLKLNFPVFDSTLSQSNFFKGFFLEIAKICYRHDRLYLFEVCAQNFSENINRKVIDTSSKSEDPQSFFENKILTHFFEEEVKCNALNIVSSKEREARLVRAIQSVLLFNVTVHGNKKRSKAIFQPNIESVIGFGGTYLLKFWESHWLGKKDNSRFKVSLERTVFQKAYYSINTWESFKEFDGVYGTASLKVESDDYFSISFAEMLKRILKNTSETNVLEYFEKKIEEDPVYLERMKSLLFSTYGSRDGRHDKGYSDFMSAFKDVHESFLEETMRLILKEENKLGRTVEEIKFSSLDVINLVNRVGVVRSIPLEAQKIMIKIQAEKAIRLNLESNVAKPSFKRF